MTHQIIFNLQTESTFTGIKSPGYIECLDSENQKNVFLKNKLVHEMWTGFI